MDSALQQNKNKEILAHFAEILETAPAYGWCGLVVTFHDGRVAKIEKNVGISLKPALPGNEK
jgi:hypothetical protein